MNQFSIIWCDFDIRSKGQIFEGYLYSNYIITSDVSDVKKIFEGDKSTYVIDNSHDTKKYYDAIDKILSNKEGIKKTTNIPNSEDETTEYYKIFRSI